MKLKKGYKYEILSEYGFFETINEEDLPENKFYLNENPTDDDISQMELDTKRLKETHRVIDSEYHPLYCCSNCMVYEMGHARRGQYYYLIFNIKENKFYVLASKPDGSGSEKEIPDIIIKLVEDGIVVRG